MPAEEDLFRFNYLRLPHPGFGNMPIRKKVW
jgi:hypothetical protein